MTYPPTPGGWQDPAGGYGAFQGQPAYPDPPPGQPAYIDPISGQPAAVSPPPYQGTQPAYPSYPAATPSYPAATPSYPAATPSYAAPAYPGYAGYGTPAAPSSQKTNGLAIASLVVSLVGVMFLACYGAGGLIGLVGAILGHVSRRQIASRAEGGSGMALAGIIVGWISLALGIIVAGVVVWLAYVVVHNSPSYNYSTPDPFST